MRQREALNYVLSLDHYPTWTEVLLHFGLHRAKEVERALSHLKKNGKIILDEDKIIVTAVTNAKLQKLIDESVSISELKRRMS